jgi:DNA-binding NarL/FixJ family response regulator
MHASDEYIAQNLGARQRDVFNLIVRGLSNKEIARALNRSEGTVKIHVAALLRKLGVHRRAAVAIAGGALSLPS